MPDQGLWSRRVSINTTEQFETGVLQILQESLLKVTEGGDVKASVGPLSHMKILMHNAGASQEEIEGPANFIEVVMAESEHPILSHTARRLIEAATSIEKLLICILSEGATLVHGFAAHMNHGKEFEIVPFAEDDPPLNAPSRHISGEGTEPVFKMPDVIILNAKSNCATDLLHEGTHYADFILLSEWLNANLKLINSGESPDDLFSQFARVTDGNVQIDEGFARIFLESRSYNAEAHLINYLNSQADFASQWLQDMQRTAIEDIVSYGSITSHAMKQFKVTTNSVFHVGEELGSTMKKTIDRAKNSGVYLPSLDELGISVNRELPAVNSLIHDLLSELYSRPKRKIRIKGPRKIRPADVNIPKTVLEAAIREVEDAGGKIVFTSIESRGGTTSTGNVYFRVTAGGRPEIGLEWGNDEGHLAGFMEGFRQWRSARDQLMSQGMKRKEAGVRAWIDSFAPERHFREGINSSAVVAQSPGYHDLRHMSDKYRREGLSLDDIDRIVSTLTRTHVNVLRTTIFMKRLILERLKKIGISASTESLNFSIEDREGLPPPRLQLDNALVTHLLGDGGQDASLIFQSSMQAQELLALFNDLDRQAEQIAEHAIRVNHAIYESAAQRLEELAGKAEMREERNEASRLRVEAEEIRKKKGDLFGQFIFGFGRQIDAEGTGGPILSLLEEVQHRLAQQGTGLNDTKPRFSLKIAHLNNP